MDTFLGSYVTSPPLIVRSSPYLSCPPLTRDETRFFHRSLPKSSVLKEPVLGEYLESQSQRSRHFTGSTEESREGRNF